MSSQRGAVNSKNEPPTILRDFNTKRLFHVIGKNQSEKDIIDDINACLKNGADINAQDDSGNTLVNIAKQKSYGSVMKFLLEQEDIKGEADLRYCSSALGSEEPEEVLDTDNTCHPPDTPDVLNANRNNPHIYDTNVNEQFTEIIVDNKLEVSRKNYIDLLQTVTTYSCNDELNIEPYPSDHILGLLALKAYSDNPNDQSSPKLPEGWELLTTAINTDRANGYFGAAFLCRAQQHVVISHRGSENIGSWWTDVKSIFYNKETSHVCSAITFTNEIASTLNKLKKEGVCFQLSITGHSLGGWLAQVTAFSVKYLQKNQSTFEKITNIRGGFHAHTVVFESPGCKSMLSKMKAKFNYKCKSFMILKRLDITSYLSAPNCINAINVHVGIVYRIITELSDLKTSDYKYTFKTHNMNNMLTALASNNLKKFEMLDWPNSRAEYNQFRKSANSSNSFHQHGDGYVFKEINRNSCSLRIFSEDELLFLDIWIIIIERSLNLTNEFQNIQIKNFKLNDVMGKIDSINKVKQTLTCPDKHSVEKVIRHTKALMRWVPAELLERLATLPSMPEAILHAEGDWYLQYLKQCRVDFIDTLELEAFLKSEKKVLIIKTPDSDIEMTRIVNIFHQIERKMEKKEMSKLYCFIDLKGIKRLESIYNIGEFFKSWFTTKGYTIIIQCNNDWNNYETTLKEIFDHLTNAKLVFVLSLHIEDFKRLLKFNSPIESDDVELLDCSKEIMLNDLTEESKMKLFEQKVFLLQGEELSLQNFVRNYKDLTGDQLDNFNKLISTQNLLFNDNIIEMEDTLLNHNDLQVHSTVNKKVSLESVARALQTLPSGTALLVISGIGSKDLKSGRWRELVQSMGEGSEKQIFTTKRDGELIFKQKCREWPDSTVYWLAASDESVYIKKIYNGEFYLKRQCYQIIFDKKICLDLTNVQKTIFVFQNVDTTNLECSHVKRTTSDQESDEIITGNDDMTVHIVKSEVNGGQILWQRSRGSLEYLRPCVTTNIGKCIDEENFCKMSQKVIIIADEPGMGKSTSLTSMSRLFRSKSKPAWLIRVDLKNFKAPIQSLPTHLTLDSVCNFVLRDNCKEHLHGLLEFCLNKQNAHCPNVYIFFDGFDEIMEDSLKSKVIRAEDKVLGLFKYLNEQTSARIWVTTRLHLREMLENALSAFAVRFERINAKQQKNYLVNFWRSHLLLEVESFKQSKLDKCAKDLYKNVVKQLGEDVHDFMGIPLQMRMLAEIGMPEVKKYANSNTVKDKIFNVMSVLSIYIKFVNLKYEIYFRDKTGLNDCTNSIIKNTISEKITEKHRMLGLRILFTKFSEENFNDPDDGWGAELHRVGLVQSGSDRSSNIEFIHRTLAEYFCADLTVEWLRKVGRYHGHAPMIELLLTELLQKDFGKVVRMFINNLFVSQPISEGVNNFIALKISELWQEKQHNLFNQSIISDRFDSKTALHVAVLEGNTGIIDILLCGLRCEPVQKGLIAFIAAHDQNGHTALGLAAQKRENKIMRKIVKSIAWSYDVTLEVLLATYIRFDIKDELKLLSEYLEGMPENTNCSKAFIRINNIITAIVPPFLAAVRKGRADDVGKLYRNMENNIERHYILLATDGEGDTALHIAAEKTNDEILNKIRTEIIKSVCCHNIPEAGRSYNRNACTPLHIAAAACNIDIMDHFINHGVYIDSISSEWCGTALFDAAFIDSLPAVKYLVEKGSDIHILNASGENVYFEAVLKGSQPVKEYLQEKGIDTNVVNKDGKTAEYYK